MVMCLVNLNLATEFCVKVHEKVHVLTKLIKCPIQYLQESLNQMGVLDKEKLKFEI